MTAALVLAAACAGEGTDLAQARAVVEGFERALHAGDRAALRQVVTMESRPAIEDLAPASVSGKRPLTIVDASLRSDGIHVRVLDPNQDDRSGSFVVVRENGELRIDLVATAGLTAHERPLEGPAQRSVVRPLSPAQRAHAARLAEGMSGERP